jgi:hypothetical protein
MQATTNQYKIRPQDIRDPETHKWVNSKLFCEEANKFMSNGYYCSEIPNSPGFMNYWNEQLKRCDKGYEIAGQKITGHHYEYLNFTQIELINEDDDNDSIAAKKETRNPDFWDGDYDYFWSIEIAKNGLFTKYALATSDLEKEVYKTLPLEQQKEEKQRVLDKLALGVIPHPDYLDGGNHVIVGKSRRKGYSYKNASICVNTYNKDRKSLTVIGAFDKKFLYPKGTMGMASNYMSFLNKHTAWAKAREYTDKVDIKTASFKETNPISGISNEAGYQSTVMAVTFGDNPDAARGKDAAFVLMEEAGAFPNLRESYNATRPGLTAGKYITGQILVFGTGGDMEAGTVDFAYMFYHPLEFGLMPFVNIWDKEALNSYCGFFHPVYVNMEGYYDEQGNSDREAALQAELTYRENLKKNSGSSLTLQQRVQEYPTCPSEAFLTVSTNDFPILELRNQFNRVMRDSLNIKYGQPCYLTREVREETVERDGLQVKVNVSKAVAKPDMDGVLEPIWDYHPKTKDLKGSVVIYEYPISGAPKGLYKIGFDPYRQQNSTELYPSLASIYVYKSTHKGSQTRETIVAQYIGRPYNPDDVNRVAELLAELYGTEVMYENEVTHVKSYFERRKKLHLLAAQPDAVISKNIQNSKVARIYGCHMNDKLKDAGEKYIKKWLLEIRDYDEHGDPVYNLETIYDPGLLEELIAYNRKGNFDRVMSFMMVMFQCEEEMEGKEYDMQHKTKSNAEDLLEMMKKQSALRKSYSGFASFN